MVELANAPDLFIVPLVKGRMEPVSTYVEFYLYYSSDSWRVHHAV